MSNVNPSALRSSPARLASALPCSERSTSVQPVKRFPCSRCFRRGAAVRSSSWALLRGNTRWLWLRRRIVYPISASVNDTGWTASMNRTSHSFRRLASSAFLSMFAIISVSEAAMSAPPDPEIERRVNDLLTRMTLQEKLGQLQQLDSPPEGGRVRNEFRGLISQGLVGSFLNVRGAKNVNEAQRLAVEQSRLKIPLLFGFDVIHGYRTIFPIPLGEASSWDSSAVERAAQIAAAEASAAGLKWTFAPMVDIARDPRWGRISEGSGEDPYLGSVMARARVRGFQGTNPADPDRVMACAKHWVAYGAAEGGR